MKAINVNRFATDNAGSNRPGKGANTALSHDHPEIPENSWFARQHDPFLFCLSLISCSSKAAAAGERC